MYYETLIGMKLTPTGTQRKPVLKSILISIFLLVTLVFLKYGANKNSLRKNYQEPLDLDDIILQKFRPKYKQIDWIYNEKYSDTFLVKENESLYLRDPFDLNELLFSDSDLVYKDQRIVYDGYSVSADARYVLLSVNKTQRWRHSFFASYYLYDTIEKFVSPLVPEEENLRVSLAVWSPTGHRLAFVYENNIHVLMGNREIITLTVDGSESVFNGLSDWIYEEEVLSSPSTIWWSPDARKLAFLRLNESATPVYQFPLYTTESDTSSYEFNYNRNIQIKYPKVGQPNPTVSLLFTDLESDDTYSLHSWNDQIFEETVVQNLLWVNDSSALVQFTNRNSTCKKADLLHLETKKIHSVLSECLTDGWFEVQQSAKTLPEDNPRYQVWANGFFDIMPYQDYNHLAFIPFNKSSPVFLTSGTWDVTEGPLSIDVSRGCLYFIGTLKDSSERHLYYVSLDDMRVHNVTDDGVQDGYYSTSFSPSGNFYVLSYQGPKVPWQELRSIQQSNFTVPIEDNERLHELLASYNLPQIKYGKLNVNNTLLPYMERKPTNFNPSKIYPVLFFAYGGPGSQQVSKLFRIDFQTYLASHPNFEYIVVTVDGRGTGFNGNGFRQSVYQNLGALEAMDQVSAAEHWAQFPFVDQNKIAIWGWSFGGYLTLKTLEASNVFSYGMAVAPVTDWRLYDSIYTERYMNLPKFNKDGYESSKVHNYEMLKEKKRFLVAHGTGDDNVHFQHIMHLMDTLNLANCYNYDMAVFPDSAHSISYHNASLAIYHRLSEWISMAFQNHRL
ncbi:dipeptidyl peptidase [Schizosaccharomyces cryophilus OY26]|uniref:Dipeptidyl peptidase n=1 Tax=Schizosaccharomyces cryophilus (strain OY26 / ATCC MYA-4695 / CBS 11777 / NBRC 106824 / NRRL Y48691) TaxID=653667 RepID=S9XHW9_SCHCR|nr:dipeptidyl peptidase [Schizosaccharomyces cryophilus OY26]EPY53276.1 dipeptidyl peptidase [Schizosaccharomyces cryophilus OY26]